MINHKVVKGETLGTIAAKYLGSSSRYKEIWAENPQLTNPNLINVGQILRIPDTKIADQRPVLAPMTSAGTQLSVPAIESKAGISERIKGLLQNKNMIMLLGVGLASAVILVAKRNKS